MRRPVGWLAAAALTAILLAGLPGIEAKDPAVAVTETGGYAGPESCRTCHSDLYESWRGSAHARSTRKVTPEIFDELPEVMVEGGDASHPPGVSTFRREGDSILITTTGPDGEPATYPVTYVVGPKRMSFFVTRMEDARLQVLPPMWEIPAGVWFDYTHLIFGQPGTDPSVPPIIRPGEPSFWTGPIRSYDRTCGRCHTSGRRVQTTIGENERLEWSPLSIDCEACHGPCADHVEFWKNPPDRHAKDPIVVLSRLPRDRAVAVCQWCHVEAEVVSPDWRPGDDALEFLTPTMLDNTTRVDAAGRPLELIYDALPFMYSRCAEEGGLTCLSCHDAHGSPHGADLKVPVDRTFTLCTGCHLDITSDPVPHTHHDMDKSGGRCVSCHMPYLTIERGHGDVRDHTIGSPMLDLYGGRVATDACTWCHTGARGAPDDAPKLDAAAIRSAYTEWYPEAGLRPDWVNAIAGGRDGGADAFYPLVKTAWSPDRPRAVRASAVKLLARYRDRGRTYLLNFLSDEDSLVRRAAAASLAGINHPDADYGLLSALEDESAAVRYEAARAALAGWWRVQRNPGLLKAVIPVLEAEARAVPLEDTRWFRLGAAKQIAGDKRGALEAYEKKLALNPWATAVRREVERLRQELGD